MALDGFFSKQDVNRQRALPVRRSAPTKRLDCETCGLYRKANSPKMDVRGEGRRGVLVLAQAPDFEDDAQGDILVGEVGRFWRTALAEAGLDLDRDCWRLNGVNCYPGEKVGVRYQSRFAPKGSGDAIPTMAQVACCRAVKVNPALEVLKPRVILLLGNTALESFWGAEHSGLKITQYRGLVFADRRTSAWVLPVFHPFHLVDQKAHEGKNPNLLALWKRDLQLAVGLADREPPVLRGPEEHIKCVVDFDVICEVLENIQEWAHLIVFDYETSGLNPFAPGHKIHSVSVVPYVEGQSRICYSFPLQYPGAWSPLQQRQVEKRWRTILCNPRIKKVAHNLIFEDLWSRVILDELVEGWEWCTMNNQHIIDNAPGTTGLKHQAWRRFGVFGYDDEFKRYVEPVLTQAEKDAGVTPSSHHLNRVHEMPLERLLLYGGYDGVLESWLYDEQAVEIKSGTGFDVARRFYHRALPVLADQAEEGVPVDTSYYQREGAALLEQIEAYKRNLLKTREAKLFQQREGRVISLTSSDDLRLLLFTHLGLTSSKKTKKDNDSADAEALVALDLPFTDELLKMRRLIKIVGTYFDQITREAVDGKVHPNTNLHLVRTYRPSIDRPNFANLPKRDKEAKLLVRRGIRVPPGFKMAQPDYGGIEVCGLGWYSEDAELLRYLRTPGADMHRDQAQNIFNLPPQIWDTLAKGATKDLRFRGKNQWVFPEFYGSYFVPCAAALWRFCKNLPIGDTAGTTVQQHLDMSYLQFEEKMRRYEVEFWRQFHGVRDWQERQQKTYRQRGYIETKLGFRYGGLLSRNQLYNYPIQGTAFHLLLWAMCELHARSVQRNWRSYVMWQVYDAMPIALYPPEQEEVLASVNEIMTVRAPERFEWINTPLKVEVEITGVDGTYADLVEFEEGRDNYDEEEDKSERA